MKSFKIEKGVRMPAAGMSAFALRITVGNMKHGDSVVMPKAKVSTFRIAANKLGFKTRTFPIDDRRIRGWILKGDK